MLGCTIKDYYANSDLIDRTELIGANGIYGISAV
jgi:hypothetical protein